MFRIIFHPAGMVVRCDSCQRILVGKELSRSAIQVWMDHHEDEPLPFEL